MGPHHEGGHALGLACRGRPDDLARPGDHGRRDRQDRQCRGGRRRRPPAAARRRDRPGLSGQGAARRAGAGRGERREIDAYVAAFEVPVSTCDDEEDEGPVYHFVETPSRPAALCAASGEGDPIVFIHGFGGDLNNWLFNIDAVAGSGPVYALDLPGHGGSTKAIAKPGLDALADAVVSSSCMQLRLTKAHLVGHSMGGAVGGGRRAPRDGPGQIADADQLRPGSARRSIRLHRRLCRGGIRAAISSRC